MMSTTTDDDRTREVSRRTKPTKRQRRPRIAEAASGGMKMLLVKMLALGIVDADRALRALRA